MSEKDPIYSLLDRLHAQLQHHGLVPRAIDAAADALRQWHAAAPRSLALADLALYPYALALDLTDPADCFGVTWVDVGVPALLSHVIGESIDVGTFTFRTDLDGRTRSGTLEMEHDQAYVDRWLGWTHAPEHPPVPPFPVNAHGTTALRTLLADLDPAAAIAQTDAQELATMLTMDARTEAAHEHGLTCIANHFVEYPDDFSDWLPSHMRLQTRFARLVFPFEPYPPPLVRVGFDILGFRSGMTLPIRLGRYTHWTQPDGAYEDDVYTLDGCLRPAPHADPPLPIAGEHLHDLGYLDSKRLATLSRLIDAVGDDGLRALLREARTRLAEAALTDQRPNRPKSVRGMLWHMLQTDALDPATRAQVLGLTTARTERRAGTDALSCDA